MTWIRTLGIMGFGLVFTTPALAQDAEPEADRASDAPAAAPAAEHEEAAPVAAGEESGKFAIGLRLGYGVPLGSIDKNADGSSNKMSDGISGQFPIWLDLGYLITPNVMLGLYGQYGFGSLTGQIKTACDQASVAGVSCSISDLRFGIQGQYHISPAENIDPWLGLGVGYEMLKVSLSGGGQDGSLTDKGFEFANLQAGVDFKPMPKFGVGPFVSFSFGQYGSTSSSGSASAFGAGGDIPNKAVHEWLTFGARGAFTL